MRALRDGRLAPSDALEAALAELETCEEELRVLVEQSMPGLRGEEDATTQLLRQLSAPAVVTDAVGALRGLTAAGATLLGLPARLALGKPMFAYVELPQRAVARAALRSVTSTGAATTLHVRVVPRSGEPRDVALHLSELPDRSVLWVAVPVTEGSDADEALSVAAALPGLLAGGDLAVAARRAADVVAELLPGSPDVGVLGYEAESERLSSLAASAPRAEELDLLQTTVLGPARQAATSGSVVMAPSDQLATWPQLAERAARHGVRSVLAFPAAVDGRVVGVLTAYGSGPARALPGVLPHLLGEAVARSLEAAKSEQDGAQLVGQLREALSSRAVIDQAKGIVMAQRGCSAEEAFEVLSKVSQNRNIRLRVLAEQLVASVGGGAPL